MSWGLSDPWGGASRLTGKAAPSKTPLFSGHFERVIAACWRSSHSSSRSAATRMAFLAQAKLAMSLSPPPDSRDRHMPGYWLSGITRPKRRRPANKIQSAPSRCQVKLFCICGKDQVRGSGGSRL